jgi:hypothetical protein
VRNRARCFSAAILVALFCAGHAATGGIVLAGVDPGVRLRLDPVNPTNLIVHNENSIQRFRVKRHIVTSRSPA